MKHLFYVFIPLFYLFPVTSMAQEYPNILKYENGYYLMSNNLKCELDSCSGYQDHLFGGIYKVEDGYLVFEELLRVTKWGERKGDTLKTFGVGDTLFYSGDLRLITVNDDEVEKVIKRLKKNSIFLYEYIYDEWLLTFKDGFEQEEYCIQIEDSSQFCSYQTGYLEIDNLYIDDRYKNIYVYRNDQLIEDTAISIDNWWEDSYYWKLPVGTYTVEFRTDEVSEYYYDVKIRTDEIYRLSFSYNNYYSRSKQMNIVYKKPNDVTIFNFSMNYGLPIHSNGQTTQSFEAYFGSGVRGDLSHSGMLDIYGTFGGAIEVVPLEKETQLYPEESHLSQYYSKWTLLPEVGFRQYFTRQHKSFSSRLFFDIGVNYSLPLYFRKVTRFDGHKISEKWLYKYNEMSVVSRIGISNGAALTFSYRPFLSIKNNLEQLPPFKVGLTIVVDDF